MPPPRQPPPQPHRPPSSRTRHNPPPSNNPAVTSVNASSHQAGRRNQSPFIRFKKEVSRISTPPVDSPVQRVYGVLKFVRFTTGHRCFRRRADEYDLTAEIIRRSVQREPVTQSGRCAIATVVTQPPFLRVFAQLTPRPAARRSKAGSDKAPAMETANAGAQSSRGRDQARQRPNWFRRR